MRKITDSVTENQEEIASESDTSVSKGRRETVVKLAYASPVIASILFSQRAAAQFTPPPPPGG